MKLKDLPIGAKLKFGKYQVNKEIPENITWLIADQNHNGYPSNSTTLLSEFILDFKEFDAKEKRSPDTNHTSYGNNEYEFSNIRQWLNSNKAGGEWYTPQHEYDEPPIPNNINKNYTNGYYDKQGFLYYFTKNEIDLLLDTNLVIAVKISSTTKQITDKIFLASEIEINSKREGMITEGDVIKIFENDFIYSALASEQLKTNYNNSLTTRDFNNILHTWERTPSPKNTGYSYVSPLPLSSYIGYYCNVGMPGIRPLCNLSNEILITDSIDKDGYYNIIYNNPKYILFNRK